MNANPFSKKLRRLTLWAGGPLLLWILAVQSGCLSFRTPDNAWRKKLAERGQLVSPIFADVPASSGRRIHAVAVRANDSLPARAFGNVAFPQRMLTGASGYHELIFDKGDHFIVWTERVRVREAILEKLRDAE